jgi:hypothetical protein
MSREYSEILNEKYTIRGYNIHFHEFILNPKLIQIYFALFYLHNGELLSQRLLENSFGALGEMLPHRDAEIS